MNQELEKRPTGELKQIISDARRIINERNRSSLYADEDIENLGMLIKKNLRTHVTPIDQKFTIEIKIRAKRIDEISLASNADGEIEAYLDFAEDEDVDISVSSLGTDEKEAAEIFVDCIDDFMEYHLEEVIDMLTSVPANDVDISEIVRKKTNELGIAEKIEKLAQKHNVPKRNVLNLALDVSC